MHVIVVGEHSFAWVEATLWWGATLKAIVRGSDLPKSIREEFDLPKAIAPDLASEMAPTGGKWNGLMFGTILDKADSDEMVACFEAWGPVALVGVLPGRLSRSACAKLLGDRLEAPGFTLRVRKQLHSELGGVTVSPWWIVHLRREGVRSQRPLMMERTPPRPLQTSLDDTADVKGQRGRAFEPKAQDSDLPHLGVGLVRLKDGTRAPVYDGQGLGPDVGSLHWKDRRFWVRAKSVYRKQPVIRQVVYHEILSVWDYEGKLESKQ